MQLDVPARVRVAPCAELPDPRLRHLIRMEACIFAQHRMRERDDQRQRRNDAATAQGARLIGTYDSQVAFGQSRVLLVWTRLIMPNGWSIVLERQAGADTAGYSGLEDEVDNHWKELLGAAALSTLLSMGTEVNSGADATNTNDAI